MYSKAKLDKEDSKMEDFYRNKLVNCTNEAQLREVVGSFSTESGMWFVEMTGSLTADVYHHYFTKEGCVEEVLSVELIPAFEEKEAEQTIEEDDDLI